MRILMLVSNEFRPDPRVLKEASTLTRAGHAVAVYAWDRERSGLEAHSSTGRLAVFRVAVPGKYGTGVRQLLGYVRFYSEVLRRVEERYDIIHCHEIDLLPLAILLRRRLRVPLICDLHEIYSMTGSGAVSWIKKWTEKALLPKADAYVLVSEMQRDYYRLGTKRAVILPNYPEESLFRGYVWQPQLHRNVFTVGYIGTVRNPRELGLLMAAAQLAPNIRVLVAGSRTEQILDYARQFSNVEVRGVFTYPQIPQLYAQIDCVFAMYGEQLNDYYAFPVKVWEALHAGKPVIVLQNSPVGKFVSDNRAGVAVDRSAESVARALIEIRSNYLTYSNRARELGAKLTWESQEGKLLDLYAMLFTKGWPCCWSG